MFLLSPTVPFRFVTAAFTQVSYNQHKSRRNKKPDEHKQTSEEEQAAAQSSGMLNSFPPFYLPLTDVVCSNHVVFLETSK